MAKKKVAKKKVVKKKSVKKKVAKKKAIDKPVPIIVTEVIVDNKAEQLAAAKANLAKAEEAFATVVSRHGKIRAKQQITQFRKAIAELE